MASYSLVIKSKNSLETMKKLSLKNIDDEKRLTTGNWVDKPLVLILFSLKERLEDLFKNGKERSYYSTRDRLYPLSKRGSEKYSNRAGDKFDEIFFTSPFFHSVEFNFVDICGGPGAWSEILISKTQGQGYGITLKDVSTNLQWYPNLRNQKRFNIVNGVKENGDICDMDNYHSFVEYFKDKKIDLCVADGGFKSDTINESYQELYCGKLLFFEILTSLGILSDDGNFVCKLFDTFSDFTISLIYILSHLFEKIEIVKPPHSRISNSERYIVCNGYKRDEDVLKYLQKIGKIMTQKEKTPDSLVDLKHLQDDTEFSDSIKKLNIEIINNQIQSLKEIFKNIK